MGPLLSGPYGLVGTGIELFGGTGFEGAVVLVFGDGGVRSSNKKY